MHASLKIFALATAMAMTTPTFGADVGVTDDTILLGMVNAQSGPAAGLGKGMLNGAQAVFKHVNANGGIHGRNIELLVADDGYEPDRTIDETLVMIEEEEVFSLFGYVGTPTSNAALPIVKEMEVPLVGLFTGAGSLRNPITRQVFNVRASYDDEAEAMVAHFLANGAKTVGVFYQDDGFGKAVLSGARKALKKRGMDVHSSGTFTRNTLAVKKGLADLITAKPDAVVMVGPYAPLAAFIKEAKGAGFAPQMATVSFVGTDNLVSAVGSEGNGVLISQVVPFPYQEGNPLVDSCRALVKADSGKSLGYVNLEGCISAKVMIAALEKAGPELTRNGLISALESMNNYDLEGTTISYSATDHQALARVHMTQIVDGSIVELD